MTKKTEDLIDAAEAAALLGIVPQTLRKHVEQGKIVPAQRRPGKSHLYSRRYIEEMKGDREQSGGTSHRRSTRAEMRAQAEEKLVEGIVQNFGAQALSERYEPVVRWARDTASPKSPGIPMLFISDVHYGEVVDPQQVFDYNSYDIETCVRRLRHTFELAVTLLKNHLAAPSYDGIVLVLGGDMINGALHEDSLATDAEPPMVQAIEMSRHLADGVAFLAQEFPRVSIYGVPGNHGRMSRRPWAKWYAKTNLDWLCYVMLQGHVKDLPNVECHFPPVRDLNFEVANRRYRLTHGDQFRGGDGIIGPIGPITRGDVRKRHSAMLMPGGRAQYDTILVAHFHQLQMLPKRIVNGSVKGFDEFALQINAEFEPPQQALWTVHPRHGQTWYMPVLCEEKEGK